MIATLFGLLLVTAGPRLGVPGLAGLGGDVGIVLGGERSGLLVRPGAQIPAHEIASKPAIPCSATVGICGSVWKRFRLVMPSTLSLPACTCGIEETG